MNAPLRRLAVVVALLFASLLISSTYVQYVSAPSLNARTDNRRTQFKEFGRDRGPILVDGRPIAQSVEVDDPYTYQRKYTSAQMYSAVTGFYSIVYKPTGMEGATNDLLNGTADQLFYRRLSDLFTGREPQGASVELTIDPKVQKAAWDALGNQKGAVVALDPKTGAILAMVSKPGYDPNALAGHDVAKVTKAWNGLLDDPDRPLDNRAIAGRLYPPGSVFKVVTAAAALSSGNYTPDTLVDGPASLDLPQTSASLPNDFAGACGPNNKVSLLDALRISCNTAFGSIGLDIGDDAIRAQAEKFGFGKALDVPLTVTPSIFPPDPNPPQTAQSAIGQFDVRVSPLQIAMVSAGVANGGVVMRPQLVKDVLSANGVDVIQRPQPERFSDAVSGQVAADLTRMMVAVVDNGTGKRAQIPGVRVAGKTGTAQQGEGRPPNAWFTAFAPADDPKVAIAVVVEDGGALGDAASGGRVAAPIAKQVIEAVLNR
ncbi:penicillin-binding protein 2 [Kineosporia sp. A_224]|uniref:peptidoglycan D,D-transpeptidase FtsI family protein n=1 Tax=Kineosporia sp. A_224 TaxID=1962180 RepID=UPI000B4B613E|nr:penicillin-binding transpeptidase domain-containing protein [Kineosporia sp. A_224]